MARVLLRFWKEIYERDTTPKRNSEFTFDPTNKVVGSIDAAGDAKVAMRDLTAAGFAASEIELLTDEEGAARIDMSSEGHAILKLRDQTFAEKSLRPAIQRWDGDIVLPLSKKIVRVGEENFVERSEEHTSELQSRLH